MNAMEMFEELDVHSELPSNVVENSPLRISVRPGTFYWMRFSQLYDNSFIRHQIYNFQMSNISSGRSIFIQISYFFSKLLKNKRRNVFETHFGASYDL